MRRFPNLKENQASISPHRSPITLPYGQAISIRNRSPINQQRNSFMMDQSRVGYQQQRGDQQQYGVMQGQHQQQQQYSNFQEYLINKSINTNNASMLRQQQTQRRQDLSPVNIQNTLKKEREYESFFNKGGRQQERANLVQSNTTVIIFGLTIPKHQATSKGVTRFTYDQLRKQVIQELLSIPKRGVTGQQRQSLSPSFAGQKNRSTFFDQDNTQIMMVDRSVINEGSATVLTNDPNLPYIEVQYSKREDAERALTLNLREFSLNNVRFVIQVRLKETVGSIGDLTSIDGQLDIDGRRGGLIGQYGVSGRVRDRREVIEEILRSEKDKGNVLMQIVDKVMSWLMPFD